MVIGRVKTDKQISQLGSAMEKLAEAQTKSAEEVRSSIDAGGRTKQVADSRKARSQELREQAKKMGRTKQARWLVFRSAHLDPDKIMHEPGEE
jgi:hypothetical protein